MVFYGLKLAKNLQNKIKITFNKDFELFIIFINIIIIINKDFLFNYFESFEKRLILYIHLLIFYLKWYKKLLKFLSIIRKKLRLTSTIYTFIILFTLKFYLIHSVNYQGNTQHQQFHNIPNQFQASSKFFHLDKHMLSHIPLYFKYKLS